MPRFSFDFRRHSQSLFLTAFRSLLAAGANITREEAFQQVGGIPTTLGKGNCVLRTFSNVVFTSARLASN